MKNRSIKIICLMVAMSATLSAQTPTPLQVIFQKLVQNFGTPAQPTSTEVLNTEQQIAGMSSADIKAALPSIRAALRSPKESLQGIGASACFAISLRSDSAELLGPYISDIGSLFNSPSKRVTGYAAMTVLNLRPAPPAEVLPPVLAALNRTNGAADAQVSALAVLVSLAPENPEVIDAVLKFMARPLDSQTRAAALVAIHTSRVNDVRVQNVVIAALQYPDDGVKLAAIGALTRMGRGAVIRAESPLQKIAHKTNESPNVQAAAQSALKMIQ